MFYVVLKGDKRHTQNHLQSQHTDTNSLFYVLYKTLKQKC